MNCVRLFCLKDDSSASNHSCFVNISFVCLFVRFQGIEHLKGLERLILYSNFISSFQEVKELGELPALRELDLRLNPLTRLRPHYRPCLVHAMPRLCILDGRLIKQTERNAATMQFPSGTLSPQKSSLVNQAADKMYKPCFAEYI